MSLYESIPVYTSLYESIQDFTSLYESIRVYKYLDKSLVFMSQPEPMRVYRILSESTYHQNDAKKMISLCCARIYQLLSEFFNFDES